MSLPLAVGSVSVGGRAPLTTRTMIGAAAAVLEELLDRVTQRGGLPEAAEHARVVGEAADRHGFVDRALERAADEGRDVGRGARDDTYRAGCFGGWDLRVKRLGQSTPQNVSPTIRAAQRCAECSSVSVTPPQRNVAPFEKCDEREAGDEAADVRAEGDAALGFAGGLRGGDGCP